MQIPCKFETLGINRESGPPFSIRVWFRLSAYPYSLVLCDLEELVRQADEDKSANRFTLKPGTYKVFRTLPPDDCKMHVKTFVVYRKELQRILSAAKYCLKSDSEARSMLPSSLLNLINQTRI